MYLAATIVLFLAYLGNVLLGSRGSDPLLGEVGEALLLLGVAVCFVIAILRAERAHQKESGHAPSDPDTTSDPDSTSGAHTTSDPDVRS